MNHREQVDTLRSGWIVVFIPYLLIDTYVGPPRAALVQAGIEVLQRLSVVVATDFDVSRQIPRHDSQLLRPDTGLHDTDDARIGADAEVDPMESIGAKAGDGSV